ncbi:hypothetical protein SCHPADRAFT_482291 [Schizopora paradoxa]|uniref:Uncharacterized protein n=1 Tax=Schizopora paradoxa TaxID=27342 RepID=A0A0H2RHU4_9AGAM|nr:hypothetical protein SCHPADRAFT_482291 [Schizopora paradoxa]
MLHHIERFVAFQTNRKNDSPLFGRRSFRSAFRPSPHILQLVDPADHLRPALSSMTFTIKLLFQQSSTPSHTVAPHEQSLCTSSASNISKVEPSAKTSARWYPPMPQPSRARPTALVSDSRAQLNSTGIRV